MVTYLRNAHVIVESKRDDCKPYGQNQFGYGNKIATTLLVRLQNDKRWRRVYVIQWSNAGSCFIVVNKQRLFISDCDLPR